MLWGQKIKVYTDHHNLTQDALGLTSNRVYRWRLLLEEYGPKIVYINSLTGKSVLARSWFSPAPRALKSHRFHSTYVGIVQITSRRPTSTILPTYKIIQTMARLAAHTDANHGIHDGDPSVLTEGSPHGCILRCISSGV